MIDAHLHLWDRGALAYPWLEALPEGDPLRAPHLPADLLAALPGPLEAAVHVEANPADGLAETRWLAARRAELPFPLAIVAHVPMDAPDAPARLAAQAEAGAVAIRDIATWHPDRRLSRVAGLDPLDSGAFGPGLVALDRLGLGFDLAISPWQAVPAARIARRFPDTSFVLTHCATPMADDGRGWARWREGLRVLADCGNVTVKLSDPMAFHAEWSRDWIAEILGTCLEQFGPDRAMFASDWPVAAAAMPYADWVACVAAAVAPLPEAAQAQVWSGTARAVYFRR